MMIKGQEIEVRRTAKGLRRYQGGILLLRLSVRPESLLFRADQQDQ